MVGSRGLLTWWRICSSGYAEALVIEIEYECQINYRKLRRTLLYMHAHIRREILDDARRC
jgi:hypothetical protein